jgi:hypothetical protein
MTVHPKGLLAFAAFSALFLLALDTGLGVVAVVAGFAINELLVWCGVAGLGRDGRPGPAGGHERQGGTLGC